MAIYQDDYRKIYENYYGPIPRDEMNRPYDIHLKDGCRTNNRIENLTALSMEDHFILHCNQKDWQAASACAIRLKKDKEIIRVLKSLAARERIKKNKHYSYEDYGVEDTKEWKLNNISDEYILYSYLK